MSCCNYKILSTEQKFVTFSSSTIDRVTKVSITVFSNKENLVTVNGFLVTAKQSGSGE